MDDETGGDAAPARRAALSRKEFLERAVARSGLKRKAEARAAVEATLAVLGEALQAGEDLNIQPLGRIRVTRSKDGDKGTTLSLRLARAKGGGTPAAAGAALAEPEEAG